MIYRVIWNSISTSDRTVATHWRTVQVDLGLLRSYVPGGTVTNKSRCRVNIILSYMSLGSQRFAFHTPFKMYVSNFEISFEYKNSILMNINQLICWNKIPTRCNRCFFIADLIACSTCFGRHYAHHQELESVCPVCGHTTLSSTPYRQLENQAPKTTGGNQLYNTLELLMIGIMAPETCWASNKICNKKTFVASSWHFISTY
jgi:hypothetical protein